MVNVLNWRCGVADADWGITIHLSSVIYPIMEDEVAGRMDELPSEALEQLDETSENIKKLMAQYDAT